jgi:hypothetical protein
MLWSTPGEEWLDPTTGKPAENATFRTEGRYELWATFEVPSNEDSPWHGAVTSPHVLVNVRNIPFEQRLQVPTAEQLAVLEEYYRDQKGGASIKIQTLVQRTENEGFALHLVEEADKRPDFRANLLFFTSLRAGFSSPTGIDGPYLKRYADIVMTELEGNRVKATVYTDRLPSSVPLLLYLKLHPEDAQAKQRLVAIAKRSANPSSFPPGDLAIARGTPRPLTNDGPLFIGIGQAWRILIELDVLHDGMTLDEATAILGFPTDDRKEGLRWYYPSMMHKFSWLGAQLRDGRLSGFQVH